MRSGPDDTAHRPGARSPLLSEPRTSGALLLVVAALLVAHSVLVVVRFGLGVDFPGRDSLFRLVRLSGEYGLAGWFSGVLLLVVAQRLWRLSRRPDGRRDRREAVLAGVFLYLSFDESMGVHEQLVDPVAALVPVGGLLTFAWVLVALPLLVVLAAVYLPWLRSLPSPAGACVLLAAVAYVGGAVGMEMVGGAVFDAGGAQSLTYFAASTLEEVLELLAVVAFLATLHWLEEVRAAGPQARATDRPAAPPTSAAPVTSARSSTTGSPSPAWREENTSLPWPGSSKRWTTSRAPRSVPPTSPA